MLRLNKTSVPVLLAISLLLSCNKEREAKQQIDFMQIYIAGKAIFSDYNKVAGMPYMVSFNNDTVCVLHIIEGDFSGTYQYRSGLLQLQIGEMEIVLDMNSVDIGGNITVFGTNNTPKVRLLYAVQERYPTAHYFSGKVFSGRYYQNDYQLGYDIALKFSTNAFSFGEAGIAPNTVVPNKQVIDHINVNQRAYLLYRNIMFRSLQPLPGKFGVIANGKLEFVTGSYPVYLTGQLTEVK